MLQMPSTLSYRELDSNNLSITNAKMQNPPHKSINFLLFYRLKLQVGLYKLVICIDNRPAPSLPLEMHVLQVAT